ncbi:MAG TPA: hypothetical protein VK325_11070 [Pseudoxanthomonas sp.]|nr:hypothetical protein [Pseudoxanthomonas sp.]
MDKLLIKQLLFYGSWLVWPFMAWLAWRLRARRGRGLVAVLLAGCALFAWARFVEPQRIRVQETVLAGTGGQARLVLISDIHLGAYKDSAYLRRLVGRINSLQADAVMIAGIDAELRAALATHRIHVIEGEKVTLRGFRVAGLGDRWANRDDTGFLSAAPSQVPVLVLTHNPDSAIDLGPDMAALVLAGHTHGGQIRIPWLYKHVIPSQHGSDRGEQFLATPRGRVRVYTTVGTGEIGLPMRLFNPPTIDVLDLRP